MLEVGNLWGRLSLRPGRKTWGGRRRKFLKPEENFGERLGGSCPFAIRDNTGGGRRIVRGCGENAILLI